VADAIRDGDWDLVIKPHTKWMELDLRELARYRDLVYLLVKRDVATVYKQTILGPVWFVIQPIVTTIIYTFIFGNLAGLSTDGVPRPLFYFGGTMLWNYFQLTLLNISDTFVINTYLFSKVYFPRLTVPLSKVLSNLISLGVQAATLAALYVFYIATGESASPSWWILALPFLVAWLAILAAGIGLLVSALTKKYRDLRQLLSFGMHLWMYATPIVYPLSQVPDKLRWIMMMNPATAPIELFRTFAFGLPWPDPILLLSSALVSCVILVLGLGLFRRSEADIVDVA